MDDKNTVFKIRQPDGGLYLSLRKAGLDSVMARLFASRKVGAHQLDLSLSHLLPVSSLTDVMEAGRLLAGAIEQNRRICVIADYDSDGATSAAVMVFGLRRMGADVDYIVPDRHKHGYGLSPAVMDEVIRKYAEKGQGNPDVLVTVDNGIVAYEGIRMAKEMGISVVVTDHHLAGDTLPDADCVVNPNRRDCGFESKAMAGCGVAWYVVCATLKVRKEKYGFHARADRYFDPRDLLDYVAVGTVADVVPLDYNNRILIQNGLTRIRNGRAHAGVYALFAVSGSNPQTAKTEDIAFRIAPRINAAGRLSDMSVGIDCLLSETEEDALELARRLNELNILRRSKEKDVSEGALQQVEGLGAFNEEKRTIVVSGSGWEEGVVGIVASRLKEKYNRPSIVWSESREDPSVLKGSARSIAGFHFRDALVEVDRRIPGALVKFGGHAMAAGMTVLKARYEEFCRVFEEVAASWLTDDDMLLRIEVDGGLHGREINCDMIARMDYGLWGQCFPAPSFKNKFRVLEQRQIGSDGSHKKMVLSLEGCRFDAVKWRCTDEMPEWIEAEYTLSNNTYNGHTSPQLMLGAWKESEPAVRGNPFDEDEAALERAIRQAEHLLSVKSNGSEKLFGLEDVQTL